MTHAMTGRSTRSHLSEALTRHFIGTPEGWTFCGLLGLIVAVNPRLAILAGSLDFSLRDRLHCQQAMMSSIDRAYNE